MEEPTIKDIFQTVGPMGTFAAIILYMVFNFLKSKKDGSEIQIRDSSRQNIEDTKEGMKTLLKTMDSREKVFFEMRGDCEEIHKTITRTDDEGNTLIYQTKLRHSIDNLSEAVKKLADK